MRLARVEYGMFAIFFEYLPTVVVAVLFGLWIADIGGMFGKGK